MDMPSESNNPKDISFENPTRETLVKADQKPEEDGVAKCDIGAHEKALRKQNKVLPCPRCNSWETKFCYFNNYSVSQPRYFCKNCQRYWTAGGTIRKIPVGAGRRKNKHSSSVTLPDVVSETCSDALNLINNQRRSYTGLPASSVVRGNEEVLELSKDAPQCESMQNVLNLKDQDSSVEILSSATGDDNEEPMSTISSSAAATSQVSGFPKMEIKQVAPPGHCNCFNPVHTLQNYPVSQCPCHWNSAWNAVVFGPCSGISNTAHIGSPPMVHFNGFGAPSITFPFLPSSYWGCLPTWDNMKWNEPQAGFSSGSSASALASTGNGSLALGKHSREANSQPEVTKEQCLWVPKTLRIDDPEEAAKSSIWSTLGIRFDKEKPSIRDGIFKAFQPKSDSNSHTSDVDQILKANPAAFSRCQSFQEGN